MNYIPTKSDLLEMSLHHFAEHAADLQSQWGQLTGAQQQALVAICRRIAEMPQHKDIAA